MNVDKSINKLLQREDCVVIPGFGGFVNKYESASFDPQTSSFSPPRRVIGFNAQLCETDGLLTQFLAQEWSMDYNDVSVELQNQVEQWNELLHSGNSVVFEGIGSLQLHHGLLNFTPATHQLPLLSSYGLAPVQGVYISRAEDIAPSRRYLSQTASYAAGIAFALSMGVLSLFANQQMADAQWSSIIPLNNFSSSSQNLYEMQAPVLQLIDNDEIQDGAQNSVVALSENRSDVEYLPSNTELQNEVAHKGILPHQVIGGSFKKYFQAMEHEAKLKKDGYAHAAIIGKVGSFYMVAYETFATAEEALAFQRALRAEGKDAFIR
ncbi:MAG: SPOR domain-containing protein [Weeksellaceae bacterium]|nr:SPOR domain-containing protein [Weeksellaceae bacterium]